jgi:hypothetical protein
VTPTDGPGAVMSHGSSLDVAAEPGGARQQVVPRGPARVAARGAIVAVPWASASPGSAVSAPALPPPTPPQPAAPPASGPDDAASLPRRARRTRSLPPLRIGRHIATETALERVRPSAPAVGLALGWDKDNQPIMARLFRPEPTRMTLVGGLWITRVLAVRALALGASVSVFTTRPEAWQGFDSWATGGDGRVQVFPAEHRLTAIGSPRRPLLYLYDAELLAPPQRHNLGPWQAQLTVLRQLTAYGVPTVQESNLVVVRRLARDEATTVASTLRLSKQTTAWLEMMPDDVLAVLSGGTDEYASVRPTLFERARFGRPVAR